MVVLKLPYHFKAEHIPPRARNPVDAHFGGTISVEIEEVTSEEAPVVVMMTHDTSLETKTREIRAFEGRFYEIEMAYNGVRKPVPVTADMVDPLTIYRDYNRRVLDDMDEGKLKEYPDGRVQNIESDPDPERWADIIEDIKQKVIDAAAKFVFIDGALHRKVALPTIRAKIDYESGFSVKRNSSIRIDWGGNGNSTHEMRFPIGEMEMAEAWAMARSEIEGHCEIRHELSVDILRPDLVHPQDTYRTEACRLCDDMMALDFSLATRGDEFIDAWQECRRANTKAKTTGNDDDVEAMIDAWLRFYKVFEVERRAEEAHWRQDYRVEDELHYKALVTLAKSWETRPIAHAADFLPSCRG